MKRQGVKIIEDIDKIHVIDMDVSADDLAYGRYKPIASFDTFFEAEQFVELLAAAQGKRVVKGDTEISIILKKESPA